MERADHDRRRGLPGTLAAAVALLLAIRFSASTVLAGFNLSSATLAAAGQALEGYELALPFPLFAGLLLLFRSRTVSVARASLVTVIGVHVAAFATWGLTLLSVGPAFLASLFLVLAVGSVGSISALALAQASRVPAPGGAAWAPWAHRSLALLVPLVLAMRLVAYEGLEATPGSGGSLEADWLLVNLPTVLLELFVITVWAEIVLSRNATALRARWAAFLPFVLVPLVILAAEERPLSGYVLSALIDWGANLALFAPAPFALGLATAAFAAYASALLLLRPATPRATRNLLFLASASIILAGFYPAMASVEGLSVALLLTTIALIRSTDDPGSPRG